MPKKIGLVNVQLWVDPHSSNLVMEVTDGTGTRENINDPVPGVLEDEPLLAAYDFLGFLFGSESKNTIH